MNDDMMCELLMLFVYDLVIVIDVFVVEWMKVCVE